MKKNWKTIILVIGFIISLLFLIPTITHNIVSFMCSNDYLKVGSEEQWIGFYGAVIGGALTLIGVWWTIYQQKQMKKVDLAIQYKPYLTLTERVTLDLQEFTSSIFKENNKQNMIFDLIIKNKGRGEGIIISTSIDNNYLPSFIEININIEKQIIFQNEMSKINIHIQSDNFDDIVTNRENIKIPINVLYTDFYQINKYTLTFYIEFSKILFYLSNDFDEQDFIESFRLVIN